MRRVKQECVRPKPVQKSSHGSVQCAKSSVEAIMEPFG